VILVTTQDKQIEQICGKIKYMGFFSFLNSKSDKIKEWNAKGAIIIDVRSKEEFRSGHIKGAKNMPLPGLNAKLKELKAYEKPIIFCCASGMRSGQATAISKQAGIECMNGGGWSSLSRKL
jgi:phage shock protein E